MTIERDQGSNDKANDAKKEHWRQWAIEGMPADKIRLAEATWDAAIASVVRSAGTRIVPSGVPHVLSALASNRCYACGWPLGSCKPFDCGMRYRDDTAHLAERENWLGRAKEMADVLAWATATITQTPGELATAPKADTLGIGVTGRRDGHSALRVRNGELERFDPHPESATRSATEPMMVGGFCSDRERCVADRNLLARAYAYCHLSMGPEGMGIATDIAATLKQPHEMIIDRAIKATTDRKATDG